MRLYDTEGKLVVNVSPANSFTINLEQQLDTRFWRKDVDDIIDGENYAFSVAGSNFRIYAGKAQILNDTTGLWHDLKLQNDDSGGVTWAINETGSAATVTSGDVCDHRYWRRDVDDVIDGENYSFSVAGSNFRIYAGQAQIQNDTTQLWHTLRLINDDGGGVTWAIDESGIA